MSDGFLARWAERKRAVRQSERPEPAPLPEAEASLDGSTVPADEAVLPDAVEGETERELLADLPSLSDITAETDLTPFLRAGIPAALRNAALRRMWSVDPSIRDYVSEAREYFYDWNTPGSVPGLGPLLPTDDVKAMLGRLINAAPSEDTEDTQNAEGDSGERETHPPDTGDSDPEAEPAHISATTEVAPEPRTATVYTPPEPAPAISANEVGTTADTVVTKQRLRRHGGAMPT